MLSGINMRNSICRQTGVTLIEILVTVIILAIGFLGLASVQLMGARNVSASNYRTLATIYAHDMAERMRANQVGVSLNSYGSVTSSTATDPGCTVCTPAQMADKDAAEWHQLLSASPVNGGLPNGSGSVTYDSGTDVHRITVSWSENVRDAVGAALQTQSYNLDIKL